MKKEILIITSIVLAFGLPLATSSLLDINWISNSIPRYTLVILLMLGEIAVMLTIIKNLSK